MIHPLRQSLHFALASLLLLGAGRAQNYQPKPSGPAPDLPAKIILTPRTNFQPSAGLFGDRCNFDPVKADMKFFGDVAVGGVRIPKLPRDTRFQVEFVVRAVTDAKFALVASNGNDVPSVRTFFNGPKGLNRIFIHAKATKEQGGFASLRCFAKDAEWSLVSATVTPE